MMAEYPKWEYRVETFGSFFRSTSDVDLETALNDWGLDGWEVINVHIVENTSKVVALAKRPMAASTRRRHTFPE
jgi:hypothetical protein